MASFTDTIPTFNPYVQQLPVEAMVQVGQQKQQQYNIGVDKIQASIDKIGGLELGRDVDKAYAQSKINELGNNLKTFMASDFSDSQLVNSITGMTGQIANDPYIKAAVYSTANDSKQMKQMEKDKQEGKLTPHAEYNYQLKRSKYYNNPDLKTENGQPVNFSGTYDQSWDIDKNIIDAVKAVGDSKWSADTVFKTDGNGNFIKDKNGIPILSEYAVREKREGKFNENITAAIDTVLNRPEARKELSMRGVYNYREFHDVNDFVKSYEYQRQKGMSMNQERKLDLLSKITTETDPAKVEAYKTMVNKIDGDMVNLSNSADLMIAQAEGYNDVDAYKASLETQKIRNDYRTAFVTEQYTKEYIENIPYNAAQKKIENERDWWSKQQTISQGWANVGIAKDKLQLDKDKWAVDPKNTKALPLLPGDLGEFTLEPVENKLLTGEFLTKGEELSTQLSEGKRKFVADYLKAINNGNGKDVTTDEVNKSIDVFMQKDPSFIDKYYEKGKKDVTDHPENTYFSNLSTQLPSMLRTEKEVNLHSQHTEDMNNSAGVIAAGGKEVDFSSIQKNVGSHIVEYEDPESGFLGFGQKTIKKTVTPTDLINLSVVNSYGSNIRNSDSQTAIYEKAKKQLEEKFKISADKVSGIIFPHISEGGPGRGELKANKTPMAKLFNDYNKVNAIVASQKFSNVLNAKEAYLKDRSMGNASVVTTIYGTDATAAQIKSSKDRMAVIVNTFKEGDINVSEFNEVMKNNPEYTPNIKIDRESGKIELALYDGEQLVKALPLTERQMRYIKPEMGQVPSVLSDVQRQITWSGSAGTTNMNAYDPSSPSAYKSAYYPSTYFFNKFNRTDILGADIKVNGMGQPNVYLYVKDGNGVKGIPVKKERGEVYPKPFISVDAAEQFIAGLQNSGEIDNLINNSKPKPNN